MSPFFRQYLDRGALAAMLVAGAMLVAAAAYALGIAEGTVYPAVFAFTAIGYGALLTFRQRSDASANVVNASESAGDKLGNWILVDYDSVLGGNLSRLFAARGMPFQAMKAPSTEWTEYLLSVKPADIIVFNDALPYATLVELKRDLKQSRLRVRYVIAGVATSNTATAARPTMKVLESSGEEDLIEYFLAAVR